MATNIPPHNLKEVCNALIALLDNRELPLERLLKSIHGPDFPTGGVILNSADEIRQIYATGQGTIKLRGTYEPHPERPNAVLITSIPYGIEKDALVERIGELIAKGQVPQLTNVKDLSTDDIRILLELKPGANADAALAYLFKNSPLQINYSINLTCLLPAEGAEVAVPARLDLKTILQQFLDFRLEVVTRRLQYELREPAGANPHPRRVRDRLQKPRRGDRDHPRQRRQGRRRPQADGAVRALRRSRPTPSWRPSSTAWASSRSATSCEELAQKRKRAKEIQQLLDDEPARWEIIRGELKQIAQTYGDAAKDAGSRSPTAPLEFREEDYIVDEDAWVIVTRDGWTKRQKSFTDVASIRVRDDDRVGWVYRARAGRR